jgi:hypothetical protein
MDVFVGFLGLFFIREDVGESLAPELLYLFLCAFISFMLTRNVILCIFYFQSSKWCACCSIAYDRSVTSVGTNLGFL